MARISNQSNGISSTLPYPPADNMPQAPIPLIQPQNLAQAHQQSQQNNPPYPLFDNMPQLQMSHSTNIYSGT